MATEILNYAAGAIETTRGTAIAAMTRKWYPVPGTLMFTDDVGTISPKESWANFAEFRRHYAGLRRCGLVAEFDVTYTDLAYYLNFGLAPLLTGSVTDTSAYTWTQTPSGTADNLKSVTVETGWTDLISTIGWRIPGLVCNEWALTWTKADIGDDNTGLRLRMAFMTGSAPTDITSFTGSLSDRTLVNANGMTTLSYANVIGSAHGTTADAKIRQATLTVNNGYVYKDGFGATSTIAKTGPRTAVLTLQRYFDDNTERAAYIAKTARRIQLITTGALVGAATALETVKINYTGVHAEGPKAEVNGMVVQNFTMRPQYDSGISSDIQVVSINADSGTLT